MNDDNTHLILLLLLFVCVIVTAFGMQQSTMNYAVENCIKGHSDWTVTQANNYCNSLIRKGEVP